MKTKNKALLISESREFSNHYTNLLKKHNFEVLTVKNFNDWDSQEYKFDIFFIDNRNENFQYPLLFDHINKFNPQSVVIDIGSKKVIQPPGKTFVYQGQNNNISLDSFIENINGFLKRAKARTELAAMLIHDIRSPLHSMIAYIELLLNHTFGPINEGQTNILEKAMILGDQTLDMLEDINEVYKSEQYIFSLEKENFPLTHALDQALLNLWIQADQKNIKIKKDIPRRLTDIAGDSFQIQRVFVNLLGNAIKYCPENATILVKAEQSSKHLAKISVMDNGGGIPEEDLKKVFKKSFRIKQNEQLQKGYGLGLYICKLIIKAHGGTIKAENNDMGGVSFIFTLPSKN